MAQLVRDYDALYIDGAWRPSVSTGRLDVVNPATGAVVASTPDGGVDDAEAAVRAARRAFDDGPWPRMAMAERADAVEAFVAHLEAASDDLAALVVTEIGAPQSIAGPLHVGVPFGFSRYYLQEARRWKDLEPLPVALNPQRDGTTALGAAVVVRDPAGVVAALTPYNFPFFLNMAKVVPALLMGCTIVLKTSPLTPLQGLVLGDAATAAGLPAGVLNIVTGDVEVGTLLTTDPRVDLVTFTGSDVVGSKVMAQAAGTLKRVLLELGGKSATIIRADADLSKAIRDGVGQIITQCGQGCALRTRHLVHHDLHDAYVAGLTTALEQVTVGDPVDPAIMMGPLIRERARERVERYVGEGLADGAEIAHGGERPAGLDEGFFYAPTLLTGVGNHMSVAQEEIFGPVGVVIPFEDDDEAVTIANDSRFGLGGAVWSADTGTAFRIARRIRTGQVSINGGTGGFGNEVPFGGVKHSGVGREFGVAGLEEFTEQKGIKFRGA